MKAIRTIYEIMPPTIKIPEELQTRRVEVVLLELEADENQPIAPATDWPKGVFERTAGAWQGEPLQRAPQGDYEHRLELE